MSTRSYEELITIPDYDGRIKYLQTNNVIGEDTFGGSRMLNQMFYKHLDVMLLFEIRITTWEFQV